MDADVRGGAECTPTPGIVAVEADVNFVAVKFQPRRLRQREALLPASVMQVLREKAKSSPV